MKKITLALASITLVASTLSAEVNLKGCVGCHGQDWSKKALGKSLVVSEMNQKDIATALLGYKNNTYGKTMKGLMRGQVAKYSDEELKKAAKAIKPE